MMAEKYRKAGVGSNLFLLYDIDQPGVRVGEQRSVVAMEHAEHMLFLTNQALLLSLPLLAHNSPEYSIPVLSRRPAQAPHSSYPATTHPLHPKVPIKSVQKSSQTKASYKTCWKGTYLFIGKDQHWNALQFFLSKESEEFSS